MTCVQPRLETIKYWRQKGLLEKEIIKNLGVSHASFASYKNAHPELLYALKMGKEDADAQVVNAMFKRAIGYEVTETKYIFDVDPKTGKAYSMPSKVEKNVKHIEPNTTAQIFYTKNRIPTEWRDRQEFTGADGSSLTPDNVVYMLPDNGMFPKKPDEKKGG